MITPGGDEVEKKHFTPHLGGIGKDASMPTLGKIT